MGACPNGATPNTTGLAQDLQWIGWTILNQAIAQPLAAIWPWLPAAYVPFLISAEQICSTNPELPAPLTIPDMLGLAVGSVFGFGLSDAALSKINDYVNYAAFQHLCQCNVVAGQCSVEHDASLGVDLEYSQQLSYWQYPTAQPGISPGLPHNQYITLDPSCPNIDVTFWQLPDDGIHHAHNPVQIWDCQGVLWNQSGDEHTPINVTWRTGGTGPGCPGILIRWADSRAPSGNPNWHISIKPHTGTGPQPTPPPNPPAPVPPNTPPAPPLVCDSTTLCAIQWNIVNQLNTNIKVNQSNSTTILNENPTSYVAGNSYTVSGQGVQVVAQATLGVVVQLVTVPSSYVPTSTNPPRYYDIGWIMMGAADALDGKKWFHSSGDRLIPAFPEIDRFHYNCSDGVTITVTELLPAQASLPPPP